MAKLKWIFALGLLMSAGLSLAQNDSRISLQYSDPDRPGFIKASLIIGGFEIYGTDGDEILIETRDRSASADDLISKKGKSRGMRLLPQQAIGLSADEEDNRVTIKTANWNRPVDLIIYAPRNTSLKLKCTNQGDIYVEGLTGEFEINNVNGAVTLRDVSGSVVAHALNQDLTVDFKRLDADKAMSFTSLNGDVSVSFPADLGAEMALETKFGEIYTDFELTPKAAASGEPMRFKGRLPVKTGKALTADVNGGGPMMKLKTMNGDLYVRKAK